jgi:hypothetical protein
MLASALLPRRVRAQMVPTPDERVPVPVPIGRRILDRAADLARSAEVLPGVIAERRDGGTSPDTGMGIV